jgi:two-component system, NtrC family, nitrogen regulation response regulator GlnG
MSMTTRTQSTHRGWIEPPDSPPQVPRLRVLHHVDLARVGAVTSETAPLAAGDWQLVGRNVPLFGSSTQERPLDDATVSREQFKVRWVPSRHVFELTSSTDARRPNRVVPTGAPGAEHEIAGAIELAPGSCVAIGERVLLALEVVKSRPRGADRLGLVGESEALWALRDEIRDVGVFGRPALVMGPTGAGKELVARAIHACSTRARGPFVPINCATLPEQLVESLLFGHTRGAFTGAERASSGLLAAADGGTLFLDELGELPPSIQPKLLRVLQDGLTLPVGAHEQRRVDFRLVAATNRNLRDEVDAGRLREDLYHRIATHVVLVPPLSARRLDVPELFVHFLTRLVAEHHELGWLLGGAEHARPSIPLSFFVDMLRQPWTGNVRELQNLVEHVARLNMRPGPFRAPERQPAEAPAASAPPPPFQRPSSPPPAAQVDGAAYPAQVGEIGAELGLALKTVVKLLDGNFLEEARQALDEPARAERQARLRDVAASALFARLAERDFNQSRVAADLGTSRTTVVKLMRDLGLRRATDLTLDEIERASAATGGDLERAALALRVSPQALKKQTTLLRLVGQRTSEG